MNLDMAGATHAGNIRDHNEDAFGVDKALPAAVLADGMGGLSHGEVASETVVSRVMEGLRNGDSASAALRAAHEEILRVSVGAAQRMGSTAVIVTRSEGRLTIHWVGDSRAYLLRGGELRLLTRDHSLVQGLIDAGANTETEAESHPNRNVVTRAVGIQDVEQLEIDHVDLDARSGDRLMICSDGLHGFLPHARIAALLQEHDDNQKAASALVEATLQETEAGDNVSVICVTVA